MIVEDTDLIGDVTCDVGNNLPCFSFGAANVVLRLNGFSVTGRGDAVTGCGGAAFAGEAGVTTNNMSGVAIRGPEIVHRFRGDGITVGGSEMCESRDSRCDQLHVWGSRPGDVVRDNRRAQCRRPQRFVNPRIAMRRHMNHRP